jgi:hypothetical protein
MTEISSNGRQLLFESGSLLFRACLPDSSNLASVFVRVQPEEEVHRLRLGAASVGKATDFNV